MTTSGRWVGGRPAILSVAEGHRSVGCAWVLAGWVVGVVWDCNVIVVLGGFRVPLPYEFKAQLYGCSAVGYL